MSQVFFVFSPQSIDRLSSLIAALVDDSSKFVIAANADCSADELKNSFKDSKDSIYIIEQIRREPQLKFEMVDTILKGLEFINHTILCAERVTLLSDQDYPLLPLNLIIKYLKENQSTIYIEYFPLPSKNWWKGGMNRFPLFDNINTMIDLYGGSKWWSMPMDQVRKILDLLTMLPEFLSYFQTVSCPEESFFQTLLLNSEDERILNCLVNDNLRFIHLQSSYYSLSTELGNRKIGKAEKLFSRRFEDETDDSISEGADIEGLVPSSFPGSKDQQIGSNEQPFRQAVLMLTNKSSAIEKYQNLKQTLQGPLDLFLLFHGTDAGTDAITGVRDTYIFNNSVLHSLGFTPIEQKLLPGSNHFPVFDFFRAHPEYDYYWLLEDDVLYNGNWNEFFNAFNPQSIHEDFISSHIRKYLEDPTWSWWQTLQKKTSENSMVKQKIASFNPIYRISKNALRFLDSKMKEGWMGHHETLIPTLLYNAGFSILDFGDQGIFCCAEKAGNFYRDNLCTVHNRDQHSTMRFRPVISPSEIVDNLLYHPVKL